MILTIKMHYGLPVLYFLLCSDASAGSRCLSDADLYTYEYCPDRCCYTDSSYSPCCSYTTTRAPSTDGSSLGGWVGVCVTVGIIICCCSCLIPLLKKYENNIRQWFEQMTQDNQSSNPNQNHHGSSPRNPSTVPLTTLSNSQTPVHHGYPHQQSHNTYWNRGQAHAHNVSNSGWTNDYPYTLRSNETSYGIGDDTSAENRIDVYPPPYSERYRATAPNVNITIKKTDDTNVKKSEPTLKERDKSCPQTTRNRKLNTANDDRHQKKKENQNQQTDKERHVKSGGKEGNKVWVDTDFDIEQKYIKMKEECVGSDFVNTCTSTTMKDECVDSDFVPTRASVLSNEGCVDSDFVTT